MYLSLILSSLLVLFSSHSFGQKESGITENVRISIFNTDKDWCLYLKESLENQSFHDPGPVYLDIKTKVGKVFPFCGLKDEVNVYKDPDLTKVELKLPLCLQSVSVPTSIYDSKTGETKETIFSNQQHFKVLEEKDELLKIETCEKKVLWIKEKDASTPLILVHNGKRYPMEVQVHVDSINLLNGEKLHNFALDWCGEKTVTFKIPPELENAKFERLFLTFKDEADPFDKTECQIGGC